ncbi:MAG TPA: hypothetical protein VFS20_31565 [Longimicrobium sp.]|nr:hypothetical protein [Longimicrobium sp.]
MKKLKLDLDTVEVLSFPTSSESDALHGTVEGAMGTYNKVCSGPDSRRGTSVCCETRWGVE